MKKYLFFLVLVSFSVSEPVFEWVREYNAGFDDYAQAVATDNVGNIIVTGTSYNGTDFDCFTIKYNSLGDTVWTRRFDTGGSDVAKDVKVDSFNNIIIAGFSRLDTIYDYLIIKYDADGNLIWMRRYHTGYDNLCVAVAIDKIQNILVTGYSFNGIDYDYLTIKYTPSGDTVWTKRYDSGANDIADDIAVDSSSNVIVAGTSYYSLNQPMTLTLKYNFSGDTIWSRGYLDPNYFCLYTRGVAVDRGNNIIVLIGSYTFYSSFILLKYLPDGDTVWTSEQGWPYEFNATDITVDSGCNILVTGTYNQQNNIFSYDFRAGKFSPNGESLWVITYPGGINEPDEFSCGIVIDLSENIYITGYMDNGIDYDYLTVKYHEAGYVEEASKEKNQIFNLRVYPNPFTNYCVIHYALSTMHYAENGVASSQKSVVSMKIYNSAGQLVKQFNHLPFQPFNQIVWFGDNEFGRRLPPGIYFLRLKLGTLLAIEKVVKLD